MTQLGRYFKAPRKEAVKQWLKVELLYDFGERFFSGHSGLGEKCGTLALAIQHLVDSGHDELAVRRQLEQIRKKRQQL